MNVRKETCGVKHFHYPNLAGRAYDYQALKVGRKSLRLLSLENISNQFLNLTSYEIDPGSGGLKFEFELAAKCEIRL